MSQILEASLPPGQPEVSALWHSVQPVLSRPDQLALLATRRGRLLLVGANDQRVLASAARNQHDFQTALSAHVVEHEALSAHLWRQLTVETLGRHAPFLITVNGRSYSVSSHGLPAGPERSILTLLTPVLSGMDGFQTCAKQYGTDLSGAGADDLCTTPPYDPPSYDLPQSHKHSRRGEMLEFIPSMHRPELQFYYTMLSANACGLFGPELSEALQAPAVSEVFLDPDTAMPSLSPGPLPANVSSQGLQTESISGVQDGDPTLPDSKYLSHKKCQECGVEKSPEWRKGPSGPKTLCNACGLRYAKRLRGG